MLQGFEMICNLQKGNQQKVTNVLCLINEGVYQVNLIFLRTRIRVIDK